MELNLEQLKNNFSKIKDIRMKVTNVFQILEHHLSTLKETYSEFVQNNKQNLFVFGLDSFQFQSKLIDIEFGDMKRLFLAINNRMYCEYYKLYKIIVDYVKENITDKKTLDMVQIKNNFNVYKDLEPYKQYKFEMIQEIHENIILLLYGMNQYILNKQMELQVHQRKLDIGLNINNFINTFNYNIMMTKEKGMLFISYIDFFHNLHTKYLHRFAMKMNLMYNQVTHDIRFDDSSQDNKNDLLHDYEDENVDTQLLKQIKRSFDDSVSSNSESKEKVDDDLSKDENSIVMSSSSNKMRSLIKKNVNKIVNGGIRFLKGNKEPDIVNLSILNPNENDAQIERSLSAEEMFIEIIKQCDEVTSSTRCKTPSPKFVNFNNEDIELKVEEKELEIESATDSEPKIEVEEKEEEVETEEKEFELEGKKFELEEKDFELEGKKFELEGKEFELEEKALEIKTDVKKKKKKKRAKKN